MKPIGQFLDDTVARAPDAVAMRMDERMWTYRELDALVERVASGLVAAGIQRGGRVALSAGNSPEFVAVVFATLRLGATIVLVSTSWKDQEVAHALALTQPTHVVHDASGAATLDVLVTDRPVLRIDALAEAAAASRVDRPTIDVDDLAVMVFSSGTTGLPKAVRHSHRTMHAATVHWVDSLGMTGADRLQVATPPFHILGLLNLLAIVSAGASVRLHRRFDLETVLRAIEGDRVTIEMAVAPIALAMASHPHLERFDLSSLRYTMWGATPVTPVVAETITRRSGVRILPAYGASELPVLAVNPVHEPDRWRLDSVGLPPAGVELRVVEIETGRELGADEAGELLARSPSLMVGYLPDEANAEAIVDGGWYRTGDVGRISADGWVTITDRVKEMIKVSGFQVAPAEIEAVLLSHPAVVDCAVFGVPHPATDERVVAAVVLATGTDRADVDLRELVSARLASYKRVSEIVFLDQIPRLPSGKVLRRELRAMHDSTSEA